MMADRQTTGGYTKIAKVKSTTVITKKFKVKVNNKEYEVIVEKIK